MPEESFKRRLTTMFSADVAGYSRLMAEDEASTVKTLKAYREIMTESIKKHRGRVVDSPGDNLLAEFTSVVDAVQCAVAVQKELQARNAELPENRRMEFRIGANLGDVIEDGDRIYGDGVNIAARIEGLAEAGGVCISGTAYDQVKNKLALGYEYLREHTVKNIAEPVRVYRVLMEPEAAGKVIGEKRPVPMRWQWMAVSAAVAAVVAAVAVWYFTFRPSYPPVEPASVERMAFPLPDKPSIAVLPFENMSAEPEQEYFSDGITEAIITALARVPKLFVIARNSTFTYKGKPVKVQKVAEDLGVQHVLEGSVQRSGDRVRITAQLVDAITGRHLWAQRYDRELKDIFALQDEITIKIMSALQVKLTEGEHARLRLRGPPNLEAFLKRLKACEYLRRMNKEGNTLARQEIEEAISLAPEDAGSHALLAYTHINDLWYGSESPLVSLAQASKSVKKALALDDRHPKAYRVLAVLYLMRRQHEKAIEAAERAVALNPNGAEGYSWLAYTLQQSDRPSEAIEMARKAIRLNPIPPGYYFNFLGNAYYDLERYEEAIEVYKKGLYCEPDSLMHHFCLAAAYSVIGRDEEARAAAAEVLRIHPKFSLDQYEKAIPHKNRARVKGYVEALRKAGIPEK